MKTMNLCLGLIVGLLLCASDPACADVLYANDFSTIGANPTADGWTHDASTLDAYASYQAYPVGGDIGMRGLGAWSHSLAQNSAGSTEITMAMTLESEGAAIGGNGGFGLSSINANTQAQFTADGPRMAWGAGSGTTRTLTFTGPVAGGSVTATGTVASNVNDYWLRANLIMTIDTTTGIAQGYYDQIDVAHQVITNFDMKGSLTASQFNALFANGGMKYFGGKFNPTGDSRILIDNITITTTAIPEPASLGLLALGVLALARRRR